MPDKTKQLYVLAYSTENYDWFYSRTHANLHQEQTELENPGVTPARFSLSVPVNASNQKIREYILRIINKLQNRTAEAGNTPGEWSHLE